MTEMNPQKARWNRAYSKGKNALPWLENPLPENVLSEFRGLFKVGDTILDYGCGDGILAQFLSESGLQLICADISEEALRLLSERIPDVPTILANDPSDIAGSERFNGVLVWGVMHHIDTELWNDYLANFRRLTKQDGYILLGGHSMKDPDFSAGSKIAQSTGYIASAIDPIENHLLQNGLSLADSGYFHFKEAFTGKERAFKYFLLQKKQLSAAPYSG